MDSSFCSFNLGWWNLHFANGSGGLKLETMFRAWTWSIWNSFVFLVEFFFLRKEKVREYNYWKLILIYNHPTSPPLLIWLVRFDWVKIVWVVSLKTYKNNVGLVNSSCEILTWGLNQPIQPILHREKQRRFLIGSVKYQPEIDLCDSVQLIFFMGLFVIYTHLYWKWKDYNTAILRGTALYFSNIFFFSKKSRGLLNDKPKISR